MSDNNKGKRVVKISYGEYKSISEKCDGDRDDIQRELHKRAADRGIDFNRSHEFSFDDAGNVVITQEKEDEKYTLEEVSEAIIDIFSKANKKSLAKVIKSIIQESKVSKKD